MGSPVANSLAGSAVVKCANVHSCKHLSTHIYIYIYIKQFTVYSILYTVYSIQYTVYSIQYTVYSIQYTVYSIQYIYIYRERERERERERAAERCGGRGSWVGSATARRPFILCYIILHLLSLSLLL